MNFGAVDYSSATPPVDYKCGTCGRHGCKLWRECSVFLSHVSLECCDCAGASQRKDVSQIDDRGMTSEFGIRHDSIGWRVPAVPTAEGDTYWGSVPDEGIQWWIRLPTRVNNRKEVLSGKEKED